MAEFRVNTYTTGNQQGGSATMLSDGSFVIIWESLGQSGSGWNIFGQKYDSVGSKIGSEFLINAYATTSHLITLGTYHNGRAITQLNNAGFVVVYTEQLSGTYGNAQNGDTWRVKARVFDAQGTGSSEVVLSGSTANSSSWPSVITLQNGNLLFTWTTYGTDGSGQGVYAQIFNQQLQQVAGIFQVNSYTQGDQVHSQPVRLTSESFVIAWMGQGQNSPVGIYAQIFGINGSKIGTEFKSNTIANLQPDIAVFSNGNFVIAGQSNGDGSPCKVYAQIFSSSGSKIGSEFLVNTYQNGDQAEPSIAVLPSDYFVVTWSSGNNVPSQDGSGYGVFAQFFNSQGNKIDSEFRINDFTSSDQVFSSQIMLANSRFLVVWNSNTQDGSGNGVYAKIYDAPTTPAPVTPVPVTTVTSTPAPPTPAPPTPAPVTPAPITPTPVTPTPPTPVTPTTPAPPSDTPPTSTSFSLSNTAGLVTGIDFGSNRVSDDKDPLSSLKIKFKSLPNASYGKILDSNNNPVVVGIAHPIDGLKYQSISNQSVTDTFTYVAVDTKGQESSVSTISVQITSTIAPTTPSPVTPTVAPTFCMAFKTLRSGGAGKGENPIGDLDRKNEEIEFQSSWKKDGVDVKLDCGLYLFEIEGLLRHDLNITIPCTQNDSVSLTLIERDACNDDFSTANIACVEGRKEIEFTVTPDGVSRSTTQCSSKSHEVQSCVEVSGQVVGGSFCYSYQWGKEDCGAQETTETQSTYTLAYEVTPRSCDIDFTVHNNATMNHSCIHSGYKNGLHCQDNTPQVASGDTSESFANDISLGLFGMLAIGSLMFL